jgi:hypothetical protein
LSGVFIQVLELAREMKLLKLGTVCLDGTKVHANASRHSALSHGHIQQLEMQLKDEVRELLEAAEQADQADVPDGVSLPEEIKRRQDRLAARARSVSRPNTRRNWPSARHGKRKRAGSPEASRPSRRKRDRMPRTRSI